MKVNSNSNISFKGIYNNKALQRGLEFANDNGALFAATTTLGMSSFVRPMAIWLAPHTDKENKKIACSKSIASSTVGFGLTYLIATPFANAIKRIDKSPEKYLKPETINSLQNGCKSLKKSNKYIFATQLFKLGLGLAVAAPKAILTCATLPYVMQKLFHKPIPKANDLLNSNQNSNSDKNNSKNLSFKSNIDEKITRGVGKILDKSSLQKFSDKFHNSNFPMHIVAATDILTTSTFIHETYRSDKIEERRKKALIYNAGFSTGLSVISSYIVDKLMDKPTKKIIKKYKAANINNPNLEKQIEGIKIAKPIILVGCVYYMFIPFVSTFLADIAEHNPKLDIPKRKAKVK